MTREDFQKAIEDGIQHAGWDEKHHAAIKLRAVGRKATRCMKGQYWSWEHRCGCPLKQAGLVSKDGVTYQPDPSDAHYSEEAKFITAYDLSARIKLSNTPDMWNNYFTIED